MSNDDTQSAKTMADGLGGGRPSADAKTNPDGLVSQTSKTQGEVSQGSTTQADGHTGGHKPNIHALIGRTVDRYKIIKLLGEGGFGAVYKAEHTLMKRDVAFKTLHAELGKDPAVLYRFKKEGQVAARFRHKNAIELYDFGQMEDGTYFMAMEFLPGKDLRDYLKKQGALDVAFAFDVMIQTLAALQAAHDGGVIHRDLKPDNIKLEEREGRTDFVKVLDFGIAKIKDPKDEGNPLDQQSGKMNNEEAKKLLDGMAPVKADEIDNSYKTQVGAFFGTPEYGSPEQCAGDDIDARSDLYTMGVILYELLTGQLPFVSKTPQGYLAQHMVAPPRPISEVRPDLKIHPDVEAIIMKSMEKRPEDRYQTATEFGEALIACAKKNKIPITIASIAGEAKLPLWKILVPVGAMAAAIVAVVIATSGDKQFETEKAAFAEEINSARYEIALRRVSENANQELLAKYPAWYDERLAEVKAKMAAVDDKADRIVAEIKGQFDDVDPAQRQYDPFIARINKQLSPVAEGGDLEILNDDDSRAKLESKRAQILAELNLRGKEHWLELAAKIDGHLERLEIEEARAVAKSFDERFRSANEGDQWKSRERALEKIALTEKQIAEDPKLLESKDALTAAENVERKEPANFPKHESLYLDIVKKYVQYKPGQIARDEKLKNVYAKWKAAAAEANAALQAQVDEIFAKSRATAEYARAYQLWKDFDPKFREEKVGGLALYEKVKADLDAKTRRRFDEDMGMAYAMRDAFQPTMSVQLLEPWSAFAPLEGYTKFYIEESQKQLASLRLVAALHAENKMQLIPESRAVQIGRERDKDLATGLFIEDKADQPVQAPRKIRAFWIDRYEVTNAEYQVFLDDAFKDDPDGRKLRQPIEGYRDPSGRWVVLNPAWKDGRVDPAFAQHPVRGVTQEDAKAFAAWAGKRLPTEFEWEYAARGDSAKDDEGTQRLFPWDPKKLTVKDDKSLDAFACVRRVAATGSEPTMKAGSFAVSISAPFGLYDMCGNVLEWTSSFYIKYDQCNNTTEEFNPKFVVARGGSFDTTHLKAAQVTTRHPHDVGLGKTNANDMPYLLRVGFRCVKEDMKPGQTIEEKRALEKAEDQADAGAKAKGGDAK